MINLPFNMGHGHDKKSNASLGHGHWTMAAAKKCADIKKYGWMPVWWMVGTRHHTVRSEGPCSPDKSPAEVTGCSWPTTMFRKWLSRSSWSGINTTLVHNHKYFQTCVFPPSLLSSCSTIQRGIIILTEILSKSSEYFWKASLRSQHQECSILSSMNTLHCVPEPDLQS